MKRILILFSADGRHILAAGQIYVPGEELFYRVSYRAKLVPNTEVATVVVRTSEVELDGQTVYNVFGQGKTLASFRWFFSLDDRYNIWVDTATLRTVRFTSDIHEGGYTFRSRFDYDWPARRVATRWQRRAARKPERDGAHRREHGRRVALFNMRSADAASFRVGEQRVLQMVLEDTIRHLRYRFEGREVKKIRNMGKFNTLKFACQISTSESFSFTDGSEFFIWLSDDENKIPLHLESPIRVGSVNAYITGYKGLKYPLTSKNQVKMKLTQIDLAEAAADRSGDAGIGKRSHARKRRRAAVRCCFFEPDACRARPSRSVRAADSVRSTRNTRGLPSPNGSLHTASPPVW